MEPNTTANFILEGKQLLVKRSFVNGCLAELRTQIVDELQNCVFLRVVKTSPELKKDTKYKTACPGALVAIHEAAIGKPLRLMNENQPHYVIKYHDIVGVLDF